MLDAPNNTATMISGGHIDASMMNDIVGGYMSRESFSNGSSHRPTGLVPSQQLMDALSDVGKRF